jgi:hypothetical protein
MPVHNVEQKGRASMEWLFIILACIALFMILIIFSTIRIELSFFHRNDNTEMQITFRMYRFIKYKIKIPLLQVDISDHKIKIREEQTGMGTKKEKKKKVTFAKLIKQYHSFQSMLAHVQGFYEIIKKFCSKIKISNLSWHSAVGLGDASSSAITSGALWGIKGFVLQLANTFFILKGSPSISVVPVFQVMHSETRLSCMISFKIGHAILVMLRMLKAWRQTQRTNAINTEYMTGGM